MTAREIWCLFSTSSRICKARAHGRQGSKGAAGRPPISPTIPPTPPRPWSSPSLRTFQAPLPAASLSSLAEPGLRFISRARPAAFLLLPSLPVPIPPSARHKLSSPQESSQSKPSSTMVPCSSHAGCGGSLKAWASWGTSCPRLPLEAPQGQGQTPSLRALCGGTLLQAKAKG